MKKIKLLFVTLSLVVLATACHRGRHVIIQTNNNNEVMRVEYAGKITFTADGKGIASMSPNGYFKFKNNGQELNAEVDSHGRVFYEVNDDNKTTKLNEDGQRLLAEAIEQITRLRARNT